MYCPYCGTQVPENAAFCSSCGKSLKAGMVPPSNFSVAPTPAPKKVDEKMTQTEFIRDYRKTSGFYGKCIGLGISIVGTIFMLIFLIVDIYRSVSDFSYMLIISSSKSTIDAHNIALGIMIAVLLIFLIAVLVLQSKVRGLLREESDAWRRYLGPQSGSLFSDGGYRRTSSYVPPTRTNAGSWKCTCGRVNAYYVGTCACGRKRP